MRRRSPYPLHWSFVALAAAGRRSLWAVVLVVLGFELAFELAPRLILPEWNPFAPMEVTPVTTLVDFASFAVPCAVLLLLVRLVHRRGFWSLVGDPARARRDLLRVFLWVLAVLLALEPFRIASELPFVERIRDIGLWALWIPAGLAALLIQVGTEELYFRGYLQQQLGLLSRSRWVWMTIPSVFFGLAHFANASEPSEALVWIVWASALGFACADLTARTGTLGAATGLHLANNAIALFVIGMDGRPDSGLALFLYPFEPFRPSAAEEPPASAYLVPDLVFALSGVLVMWLAARVAVRR